VRQGTFQPISLPAEFQGWVTGVAMIGVPWAARPLQVYSIHTLPGSPFACEQAIKAILDGITERRDGADLVLGGDFNVTIGHSHPGDRRPNTPGEVAILQRLEGEWSLVNCWQVMHRDRPLARTFQALTADARSSHYDGLFVPASWRSHLQACEVWDAPIDSLPSDHQAVWATFDLG